MTKFHAIFCMICLQACAENAALPPQNPTDFRAFEAEKNIETGNRLAARGHHLEASFYYEAALVFSNDEAKILPKLIAALVRSDRLRDARNNLNRLMELNGEQEALLRLTALLDVYAPPLSETSQPKEHQP